jgi:hypothetical protein
MAEGRHTAQYISMSVMICNSLSQERSVRYPKLPVRK